MKEKRWPPSNKLVVCENIRNTNKSKVPTVVLNLKREFIART